MDFINLKKSIRSIIPFHPANFKRNTFYKQHYQGDFNRNYSIEDTSIYGNANEYLRGLIENAKRLN
jgi:hypothetical protein